MNSGSSGEPVVVFSLDVDWVPDEILDWALRLFREEGWPVTVFATHETALLQRDHRGPEVEVGIHPDFFRKGDHEQAVRSLLEIYPDAEGVRSHGLFEYANLMVTYRDCGLRWDSSQLLYLCPQIRPYRHPSGLVRLPIFWEDDDYFGDDPSWDAAGLGLETPGVKCFDFHPVHLCLNTHDIGQYHHARRGGYSREALDEARYPGLDRGVLSLFRSLSRRVRELGLRAATIGEVCSWV